MQPPNAKVERGAASIVVALRHGRITVHHGTDGDLLAELSNAPPGTWEALWRALESLGIKRVVTGID